VSPFKRYVTKGEGDLQRGRGKMTNLDAVLIRIVELIKDDKELHCSIVRLIQAMAAFKEIQTKRSKLRYKIAYNVALERKN